MGHVQTTWIRFHYYFVSFVKASLIVESMVLVNTMAIAEKQACSKALSSRLFVSYLKVISSLILEAVTRQQVADSIKQPKQAVIVKLVAFRQGVVARQMAFQRSSTCFHHLELH